MSTKANLCFYVLKKIKISTQEDICSKCVEITGGGDLGKEECCTDTPSGTFRTCEQLVNAPARQNPVLPHGLFPTPSPVERGHVTPEVRYHTVLAQN